MNEEKTHYRKVFKSDHLGVADLEDLLEEGKRLVFTINNVKQYTIDSGNKNSGVVVAGKRISANIAHFKEDIKPLVLNATNSKVMKKFNHGSPWVEDWDNTLIELYIDPNVKMKGDVVGGVRISPSQPKIINNLTPESDTWTNAVTFLIDGGDITKVTKKYQMSADDIKTLLADVEKGKADDNS